MLGFREYLNFLLFLFLKKKTSLETTEDDLSVLKESQSGGSLSIYFYLHALYIFLIWQMLLLYCLTMFPKWISIFRQKTEFLQWHLAALIGVFHGKGHGVSPFQSFIMLNRKNLSCMKILFIISSVLTYYNMSLLFVFSLVYIVI